MSETISSDYISCVLSNVAKACNLSEWTFLEEILDLKAQNYFGVLIPVTIKGKVGSESESIVLKLMLKLAPTDERYRVSGAVTTMFAREIFVYSKVFSYYDDLQKHLKTSDQYIKPKCYYICKDYSKEVIAIQNMCNDGYKPFVHNIFLDVDHLVVALKSLAKFHALSFLLESRDIVVFEEVKNTCLPLSEKSNKRFLDILKDRLEKAMRKFANSCYVSLLQNLKNNCSSFIEAAYISSQKNCLCHGDIWKENILFSYKNNKPVSACLIDFQTVRLSSPAFDVLYLLTSSVSSDLRRDYYTAMLDVYHNTLTEFFIDVKLDLNTYTRCQLDKDLKIVGPACLIVANTALWLSSGLQEEGHIRSKQIWNSESEKERAIEQYRTIVKGIIDDLIGYGYL